MTTKNTRRDFTDEFKREAVSLLRGSGRPLTQVAAELGLQPSVLRRWRGPVDEARSGATVNRPTAAVLSYAPITRKRHRRAHGGTQASAQGCPHGRPAAWACTIRQPTLPARSRSWPHARSRARPGTRPACVRYPMSTPAMPIHAGPAKRHPQLVPASRLRPRDGRGDGRRRDAQGQPEQV